MIAEMDAHFGRIVNEFERLGIWDDTFVLFLADHGELMGAHKMRLKGTVPYEELYHIPCIAKLPKGIEPARRSIDDLVSSVELPGTLIRAAGLAVPDQFQNRHCYDAFFRTEPPQEEYLFFEHYAAYWGIHPFYAVRTPTHKYVRYYGPDNCEELYDLIADPHEMHNRSSDAAYASVRAALRTRADEWWYSTDGRDFAYYESADFKANRHNAVD